MSMETADKIINLEYESEIGSYTRVKLLLPVITDPV